jgi:MFS transporter, PAT family, beta-lactamase induction signal transducer AmpG
MSVPTQSEPGASPSYLEALTVYLRPSVLVIMLLGFSSGLPLALSGETLKVWMSDRGVDLGTIGLLSLAGLPYTLKFIWAPVVDAWQVPWLQERFGRRRAWLIASQIVLIAAIVFLGLQDPVNAPWMIGLGAVIVAFASATQDIVIDAYRVQALPNDEQAAGVAGYVAAYRIGMLASSVGVIELTGWLEAAGIDKASSWPIAYAAAAALVFIGMFTAVIAKEPKSDLDEKPVEGSPLARLYETARGAFTQFLMRDAAVAILLFVVLYKLCDALAGSMTAPFVLSLGYEKTTYAAIVKGVGLIALLGGGFAGGAVARALPLHTALWIGAFLQMFSNLAFIWLGYQPVSVGALTIAIVVENFAGAIGTVIFVAYISALCRDPLHTATQYALLTALASTGRTLFAAGTGFAAAALGWPMFFIGTSLAAIPALLLMLWLQRRGHFRSLEVDHRGG